ncbi:MAG: NADH:ubiquinone reductase (Na(+)-transporting) subunit B [Gammaproteobacteria bacterium]|jgi:Na+-transporting NADH:ubiquinone oxidoreductase subunit B|nr:NADH:ubiquinone reductase (Na(+)-transporting) subunit B [Gammaproteobacteria bacterium]MBT3869592.1 NADH:ubiquinone reductase (Na(+)-transporting) subunit B [Gammaproteobacteria bacterium]MBT4380657.1 NADH:ubiquinone reductase (Na(+)-transporting) subunit B [Gammaproteobacteria bacterium]MBT4617631.1 NADH:ubiquinone reductase (Na(+)-transporting) subunit B [Gammaproteobacteria bacterium]MBT5197134.1 NADH:ubiquinone reductase (Na(+)-transporting) subunit B [Gammaproteobacteria bacterium]
MWLRDVLDNIEPHFETGGRFEKFYSVYEMVDTIFYSPGHVTKTSSHVRDAVDMKRVMTTVWWCAFFPMFAGMYYTGLQANLAMDSMGVESLEGWRGALLELVAGYDVDSIWDCLVYGAMFYVPIYMVVFVVGGLWEVAIATIRGHEVNEGFFVTSILFSLIVPASLPLWQAALGISFGVVIGKEIFGGTGKNFLNPALTGRAFLFFAYPAEISGDAVWTAVDGFSGATPLGIAALQGMEGVTTTGFTWMDAFLGKMQGSVGETSTLAIFIGGAILLITKVASWRIMAGVMLGMIATALMFNSLGSDTNPMFSMPWYWHLVLGGFAFGMVYMATDPVSAAMTNTGKWWYGALIGVMCVLIRVINPAFPEGIMLAILFANLFAPLIDWQVVRSNVKRRLARVGA